MMVLCIFFLKEKMRMTEITETYPSIQQRVIASFVRCLAPKTVGVPTTISESALDALHTFFADWYADMFAHPENYGFALTPDDAVMEGEADEKDHKQAVTRPMKKVWEVIQQALTFLMQAGAQGVPFGDGLALPIGAVPMPKQRAVQKCLHGMQAVGLTVKVEGESVLFSGERLADMLPALQALASACAAHSDSNMGLFNFGRCDLKAIVTMDYVPDAADLLYCFTPEEEKRLRQLHDFFLSSGHKTIVKVGGHADWLVQYQGNRRIKSTPLYQFEYDYRYRNPLRIQFKFASTNRLAPLLAQDEALLADFFQHHAYTCHGDDCGWCYNRKNLGPSTLVYQGETKVACWYTITAIKPLNDENVALIRQYAQLHEQLA
jgi:hypothetical protein